MTISVLGYAMLGLLARKPRTGYDLIRLLRKPIGYYWTAQQSQIYPELGRLTASDLVEFSTGAGPGPREKKTYAITPAGRTALTAWLPEPLGARSNRDELMVRTFSVVAGERDQMRAFYLTVAADYRAYVADLETQLVEVIRAGGESIDNVQFGNYATLRMGIASARLRQEWCEWIAAQLQPLAQP